jgi:hypothetical protein
MKLRASDGWTSCSLECGLIRLTCRQLHAQCARNLIGQVAAEGTSAFDDGGWDRLTFPVFRSGSLLSTRSRRATAMRPAFWRLDQRTGVHSWDQPMWNPGDGWPALQLIVRYFAPALSIARTAPGSCQEGNRSTFSKT